MTEYIMSDVSAIEDAGVPMLPKPKKCFGRFLSLHAFAQIKKNKRDAAW